jgi:hypothetical protein
MTDKARETVLRFRKEIPEKALRAIGKVIVDAIVPEVARVRGRYGGKGPLADERRALQAQAIGLSRYMEVQLALSDLRDVQKAFPFITSHLERHVDGFTYYAVVESNDFRLHAIKVDGPHARPAFRQRRNARPFQPSLFEKLNKIYCTLIYGFKEDPAEVSFMLLVLVDEDGNYIGDITGEHPIDLLQLLRKDAISVEVEKPAAAVAVPLRGARKIRRNRTSGTQ